MDLFLVDPANKHSDLSSHYGVRMLGWLLVFVSLLNLVVECWTCVPEVMGSRLNRVIAFGVTTFGVRSVCWYIC